jgi:hypothetical protein
MTTRLLRRRDPTPDTPTTPPPGLVWMLEQRWPDVAGWPDGSRRVDADYGWFTREIVAGPGPALARWAELAAADPTGWRIVAAVQHRLPVHAGPLMKAMDAVGYEPADREVLESALLGLRGRAQPAGPEQAEPAEHVAEAGS